MSSQASTEPTGKQPPSVYTVMLLLSMVFMLIAVIAMIVELSRWYPDLWRTQAAQPTAMIAPLFGPFLG